MKISRQGAKYAKIYLRSLRLCVSQSCIFRGGKTMNKRADWHKRVSANGLPFRRRGHGLVFAVVFSLAALGGLLWLLGESRPAFADSPPGAATLARVPDGPLFPGDAVQFTVMATGTQPFTYTWTLNGIGVGANAPTWTHTFTDAGLYTVSVLITNTFGQAGAVLTVPVRGCEARVAGADSIYSSVQAAIDAAPPGGVVQLAGACRGVTPRGGLQQTAYISKSLTLRGGYPGLGEWSAPDPLAYPTLLDAQGAGRALAVIGPATVTVEGLTLTGGRANGLGGIEGADAGGGVYLSGATVTISGCVIVTNAVTTSGARGGGLALVGGSAVITNSRLAHNHTDDGSDATSEYGGGVYALGGALRVANSEISHNSTRYGGGIYLKQNGALTLTGSTLAGNTLASGGDYGGLYVEGALGMEGNTLADNAKTGVGAQGDELWIAGSAFRGHDGSALCLAGANLTVRDNTLEGNRQGVDIQGSGLVAGNIISGSWDGSGIKLSGAASQTAGQTFTVTGNLILRNTTAGNGGGVYAQAYRIAFTNNVLAFNHASGDGGGMYLLPRSSGSAGVDYTRYHYTLAHNTFNGNTGANGVYLRAPGGLGHIQAELRNNLIANHAVGVNTGTDNEVTLDGTLWHANTADVAGAAITSAHNVYGDPALAADGYHLGAGSAALDAGSPPGPIGATLALAQDVDGDARPAGFGYDIGADEFPGAALQLTQTPNAVQLAYNDSVVYADVVQAAGGDVTGLVVTATLPPEQYPLTATTSQGECSLLAGYGGGAVCTVGDAPDGTRVTINVTARMTSTPISPAAMPGAMTATLTARAAEAGAAATTRLAFQYCRANVNGVIYNSLQDALDAAPAGALVKAAGYCDTFNARGSEIVYLAKTLTLRGGYTLANWTTPDPAAQPTTLDGGLAGRGILIEGAGVAPTVEGLRIIYGNGSDGAAAGGGILVRNSAAPILRNNVLEGNIAFYNPDGAAPVTGSGAGGGIDIQAAPNTQVLSNTFRANSAHFGGGLRVYQSSGVLAQGNQFLNNQAGERGGGLECDDSNLQALDNLFHGNSAYLPDMAGRGGAIALGSGGPTLRGNTLESNSAYYGGGILVRTGYATLEENVIAENTAVGQGGGVYVDEYGLPTLVANQILSNTAPVGGGLYVKTASSGSVTLRYNRLEGNQATGGAGGGAYIAYRTYGEMLGNAVTGNSATGNGGGLWLEYLGYGGSFTINSNAVVGNHADGNGGGIYVSSGLGAALRHTTLGQNTAGDNAALTLGLSTGSRPDILYSLVYSQVVGVRQASSIGAALNQTLWDGVVTRTLGASIISADDRSGAANLDADGYHLRPDSAAIDAALDSTTSIDVDGQTRPQGSGRDLGADEFVPQVNLALGKQLNGPANVAGGAPIRYTLTVSSAADSQAMVHVVVTDTVTPASAVAAMAGSAPGAVCAAGGAGQVVCTLANLPAGTEETLTVWVTPTLNYSGRLSNTAELHPLDAVETTPANNITGPVGVTVTAPLPDVWVNKTVDQAFVAPGDTLVYIVAWGNRGVLTAANVVVTDTLPAGVAYQAASGSPIRSGRLITWVIGGAAAGAGGSFYITGAVDAGLANGLALTNTAGVSTSDNEPRTPNNHAAAVSLVSDAGGNDFAVTITADKSQATVNHVSQK
jgi:uncharacterized repeat protein (TIGR01451 family)